MKAARWNTPTQSWGIVSRKLKVKHAYKMKQKQEQPRHREFLSFSPAVDSRGGELVGVVVTPVSSDPVRSLPRVTERVLFLWEIESLHPPSCPLPPHTRTHIHTPNLPTLPYYKLFVIPPPAGPAAVKRGCMPLLLKHLTCNRCYRHSGIIVKLCTPCAASLAGLCCSGLA